MASKNKVTNIRSYQKRWQMNIGIIIFGIIFFYLVITVLMYLSSNHITRYEVREGSIIRDHAYTGFAIREEILIQAEAEGYVNYYASENNKVRVGTNIYTLSGSKIESNTTEENENTALTPDERSELTLKIQRFNESFQDESFYDAYTLKADITDTLLSKTAQSKTAQLDALITSGEVPGLSLFPSPKDGVVLYSTDGMESLTLDSVTPDVFDKSNYEQVTFQNNDKISAGTPVYKLITSEIWSLVVPFAEDTAKELLETSVVKVRFLKDGEVLWADLSIIEKDNTYLGCLTFDNSMIRYASDRFLDIELILEDESGLKIPKSAEVEKSFYTVPSEYITQGGDSNADGVFRQTTNKSGDNITEFLKTEIYYRTEDGLTVYLDPSLFEDGDILVKPESNETYTIGAKKPLKGVYNLNAGYAVFKQIEILCESDEYYIVKEGNSYSLSNYDHIALNGSSIQENDIVS